MVKTLWRLTCIVATGALVTLCAACGGGTTGAPLPNDGGNNNGGRTATSLSGQLLQDPAAAVVSTGGNAISGAQVSLVNTGTGDLEASQNTGIDGRFNFADVTAGQHLVRVNFNSNSDLNGDGAKDEVELLLPVDLKPNASNDISGQLGSVDADADGEDDGIDVSTRCNDQRGPDVRQLFRLLQRIEALLQDSDGDGSVTDETPTEDADGDCMPDNNDGNPSSIHGGVIRGEISAIDEASLTVNGVVFKITDTTRWKARGHGDADPADFTVGSQVQVRSFWNGTEWTAVAVKLKNASDDAGDSTDQPDENQRVRFAGILTELSDTQLSTAEKTALLNGDTRWFINGREADGPADFAVGDFVFVKAEQDGDNLVALKVSLLSNCHNGHGGHGGGDGTDNGGGGDDDSTDSGDEGNGDDSGDSGDGTDSGGDDGNDDGTDNGGDGGNDDGTDSGDDDGGDDGNDDGTDTGGDDGDDGTDSGDGGGDDPGTDTGDGGDDPDADNGGGGDDPDDDPAV